MFKLHQNNDSIDAQCKRNKSNRHAHRDNDEHMHGLVLASLLPLYLLALHLLNNEIPVTPNILNFLIVQILNTL